MRAYRILFSAIAALLLTGIAVGAWREHRLRSAVPAPNSLTSEDAAFLRQRLAYIERENDRLRAALLARQQADEAVATQAQRAEIEHQVEQLRSLRFLHPVVYREIPHAELPELLRRKLAQQVPDQEFAADGVALSALGLLPPGIDLKTTYLELLGEQIGAFYDQHAQQLFTFSGHPLSNAQNRVILAHELTHALEDQHFALARLPLETKGDDDRVLATTALVEGDATLVMDQYMIGAMSAAALRDTLSSAVTTDVRKLAAAPRFLREMLIFPYLTGQQFCQTLSAEGGWDELAEAFRHPPTCTAEILHPERFLANPRIAPVAISFPETKALGEKPLVDNDLGEFGLRQLFARWLKDPSGSEAVAAGWRGDRYLVYGDAQAASYVWKIASADASAAVSLCATLRRALAARYHLSVPEEKQALVASTSTAFWSGSAGGRQISLWLAKPTEIVLVDAADARWSEGLGRQFVPR